MMSELKKFEQILDNQHVNYFTRETLKSLKDEYEKALGKITELQTKLAESEARVGRLQSACEIYSNDLSDMGLCCPKADLIAIESGAESMEFVQTEIAKKAFIAGAKFWAQCELDEAWHRDEDEAAEDYAKQLRQQQTNGECK